MTQRLDFGIQGEYRKDNKKTRISASGDTNTGIVGEGGAFHANLTKRKMTANQIAAGIFFNALRVYPQISPELRRNWKDKIVEMEQLRFMNMAHLAAALVILHSVGGKDNLTPEVFTDRNFNKYLPNLTKDAVISNVLQHKEVVFSYIRAYIFHEDSGIIHTQNNNIADLEGQIADDETDPDQLELEEEMTTI
jgi:hypothetical protein